MKIDRTVKSYIFFVVAAIVLGFGTMFLTHPGKTYSIYMTDEIKEIDKYINVAKILAEAQTGDVVKFYLAGYGGNVDGETYITDSIKKSKAYVEMHVVGPAYSAHAYLALSGNKVIMYPYSFLMFHVSSVYELDCDSMIGMDRGISKQESCNNFKSALLWQNRKVLEDMILLTAKEKEVIMAGREVYLFPDEIEKRQWHFTSYFQRFVDWLNDERVI